MTREEEKAFKKQLIRYKKHKVNEFIRVYEESGNKLPWDVTVVFELQMVMNDLNTTLTLWQPQGFVILFRYMETFNPMYFVVDGTDPANEEIVGIVPCDNGQAIAEIVNKIIKKHKE